MRLIEAIEIEGVRSIQHQRIDNIGSFNVLVGRNSSGKSNVLRALNLFFNAQIEPGKSIDFARDHYEQHPRKRKKKRISVRVEFNIPEEFRFRQGLEALANLGQRFSINRSWSLDQLRRPVESISLSVGGNEIDHGEELSRQFLSLVSYRYIPNQTVPSKILQDESQAVANSIFGRMKGDQHAAALLQSLHAAAGRMLEEANSSFGDTGAPLSNPSVSTADSIGEMLTMSGFQALGAHGLPVQDEDWGAGHQAFFLYQILKTLDTSYSQFFGWKQATIWGIEEPEAGLHRDLETRLANQIRSWSVDPVTRMQMFATTHSPIFTMASEQGAWVEIRSAETVVSGKSIPELTKDAEIRGVSGWVHPILYFPWNPVVLVEGPIDADILNHVAGIIGCSRFKFLSLSGLDPDEPRGGKDKIISFLKQSSGLAQNRPAESPFFVYFDWDVSNDEVNKAKRAYGEHSANRVFKMAEEHCDPLLSKDFKGIERFYPSDVVREANDADEIAVAIRDGRPFSVSQNELNRGKQALKRRVLALHAEAEVVNLVRLVRQVEQHWNLEIQPQQGLFD